MFIYYGGVIFIVSLELYSDEWTVSDDGRGGGRGPEVRVRTRADAPAPKMGGKEGKSQSGGAKPHKTR